MSLITTHLFFGISIDKELLDAFKKVPHLYDLFVKQGENYLQEYIEDDLQYIGKPIEDKIELSQLELLQINIYSLLKKILPDYPFEKVPLQLFPIRLSNEQ